MYEQQELTAPSILALFQTTKDERRSFVQRALEAIEEGQVDPLKLLVQIKSMEAIADMFTNRKDHGATAKRFWEAVNTEAQKRGKKFTYLNAEMEQKEVGVTYDYSQCGDPVILDLLEQEKALKEQIKTRQELLKNAPAKGLDLIEEGGEVVTVFAPAKSSTTTLAVKLK